jgi:hypothetical protein
MAKGNVQMGEMSDDPNALDAHGLEFQHHQGTQHVLQKCLVGAQRDLVAGLHVSTHQV